MRRENDFSALVLIRLPLKSAVRRVIRQATRWSRERSEMDLTPNISSSSRKISLPVLQVVLQSADTTSSDSCGQPLTINRRSFVQWDASGTMLASERDASPVQSIDSRVCAHPPWLRANMAASDTSRQHPKSSSRRRGQYRPMASMHSSVMR